VNDKGGAQVHGAVYDIDYAHDHVERFNDIPAGHGDNLSVCIVHAPTGT